jgi:acyl carrier protein
VESPMEVPGRHVILAAAVALAIALAVFAHVMLRRRARAFVRGRAPLDAAGFAALFPVEAEAAIAPVVRACLRGYVPVDLALVRPDDRLCEELQLAAADGLDADEFIMAVEKAVRVEIPDAIAQRMFTLRHVIAYVAAQRENR